MLPHPQQKKTLKSREYEHDAFAVRFFTAAPVGSGTCSNGISGVDSVNGDFCCPTLCGMCGGPGCSSFPGGADNCCTSVISQQDVLCSESGTAPCIINDGEQFLRRRPPVVSAPYDIQLWL